MRWPWSRVAQAVMVVALGATWGARAQEESGAGDGAAEAALAAIADGALADSAPSLGGEPSQGASPKAAAGTTSAARVPADRFSWHVPDPELDRASTLSRLEASRKAQDKAAETYLQRVLERVDQIRRPRQLRLGLEEAIQRTLENNYKIQVASYSPAVETTRVVEADAAFDAVAFTDVTKNHIDRPTGSQLSAANADLLNSDYGVRKVLPTGTTVSAAYAFNRTYSSSAFQQINPEYTSNFILEMRQPLLRGFGVDFNRSMIVLARNDRGISDQAFRQQVRDVVRAVEEYYWRVVQTRRDVAITARLMADYEAIYEYLVARQAFDVSPVQLAATKANLEEARTQFVVRVSNVYDAEDRLISAMNSPDVHLANDIEIIPIDVPRLDGLTIDRLAEVQTALEYRTEIRQQELRVESAKIVVGRQKNLELPLFDLTFRTTFDGLAGGADRSFDELTRGKYVEYFVGVRFEVPIGNRGPKAAHKRAKLQHDQQAAQLKSALEDVILDTNLAVRAVTTAFDAIGPSFESAEAREREVDSIVARAERKDFVVLNQELGSRQSLAAARRTMLGAMVQYNVALIDLERAKGTLLEYHNIHIPAAGE